MDVSSNIYCPVCNNEGQDVTFTDRQFLHEHLENLHGYFKCSLCPVVVYVSPESLEQHNTRFHQGELVVEVEQVAAHIKTGSKRKSEEPYPPIKYLKHDVEVETELEPYIDTSTLTEGEYSQPSRYSKDPLKGFFLQAILECKECPQRPSKKFATHNAWQLHIKTFHKELKTMTDYKNIHGDPDLVKFKHKCRLCSLELILNLSVVKRHLRAQHQTSLTNYMAKYREELINERLGRPIIQSSHTLEGWWEGCMYNCKICDQTFPAQMAFENHLSSNHDITGQREIEEKYVGVWGRLSSLTRVHQCYICRKVIRHEYKIIFQHLSKHKLDIETYATRYRDNLVKELTDKGMAYVLERESDIRSTISLEDYLVKHNIGGDTTDPMEGWYDCSEHRCALCDKTFWSNLRFHSHIKREHGITSTKEYRKVHGDPEVTLRQHKCQICYNLIKWEASRIRDHLKFHKDPSDKLSLREYGEKFKDYIIQEVTKVKIPSDLSKQDQEKTDREDSSKDMLSVTKSGHTIVGETPDAGYTVTQWKELFSKKVSPDDKVECNVCKRTMNRHSFTRHQERAHKGILNMRDLNRLKRKQLQMAQSGVIKSLSELMRWAGGVSVVKGKGECKEEVDLEREDQESRLNLYKAGLTLEQIESKVNLINSGLTITKANSEKVELDNPDDEGFPEIVEQEGEASYPTYVVDQETGEILVVEQITSFDTTDVGEFEETESDGISATVDSISSDVERIEQDNSGESRNIETGEVINSGPKLGATVQTEIERFPNVWQDDDSQEDDNMEMESETGPLDGQIMEIDLSAKRLDGQSVGKYTKDAMVNLGQVRFIRLEEGGEEAQEQELEEEMLQSEYEMEYVLEGGQLRKIQHHISPEVTCDEEIYNHEADEDNIEKMESLVMLSEDGSAHIVISDEQDQDKGHTEREEQFSVENNGLQYILGQEIDRKCEFKNCGPGPLSIQSDRLESTEIICNEMKGVKVDERSIKDECPEEGELCKGGNLKEIRKNLLLEHREEQTALKSTEVIHQSELLDSSGLVTGYLVLGEGDQLVLEDGGDKQVVHDGGQEMMFVGKDQLVFTDNQNFFTDRDENFVQEASTVTVNKGLEEVEEITETNHYIQVVDQDIAKTLNSMEGSSVVENVTRVTRVWEEVGGADQEYHKKFVSKPRVELTGKVSQGTVVCQWTKMPGDRVRVAHSKVIMPRVGQREEDRMETNKPVSIYPPIVDISAPLVYSTLGTIWRDVGCQVVPHRVNGMPSDRDEEKRQVDRIQQFLACGGVLDRSCPGCGKVMSRQRNLVTHLKVLHGVEVHGPEGEEHMVRYSKENMRVQCDICNKTISRKSIKRHVNLCHPADVAISRFTKEKSKPH